MMWQMLNPSPTVLWLPMEILPRRYGLGLETSEHFIMMLCISIKINTPLGLSCPLNVRMGKMK